MKKILILVFVFALFMVGCSEEDPLIGSWFDESSGQMITFEEDGTCSFAGTTVEYKADETQLTLIVDDEEQVMNYVIEHDELVLSFPDLDDFELYFKKIIKNN